MKYIIQLITVIVYFLLPVYMDFLQVNMFLYINIGFTSAFPAPLLSLAVYVAAFVLILSPALIKRKRGAAISLIALLVLFIPIIQIMVRQWQFNSTWSTVAYSLFFILVGVCIYLSMARKTADNYN